MMNKGVFGKSVLSAALPFLFLVFCPAIQAAPIVITGSSINTVAKDTSVSGSPVVDSDSGTAFGSRSVSAVSGSSHALTNINFLTAGSGALLDFDFSHQHSGTQNSLAQTYENSLYFTALADASYDLSGQYSLTGSQYIRTDIYFYDITASMALFRDYTISENVLNENFLLGTVGDGNISNSDYGPLSGTLVAGHDYRLYFEYMISASTNGSGASATGCLTLAIDGATGAGQCGISSVPEPDYLLLFGLGLVGLSLQRRYKNSIKW